MSSILRQGRMWLVTSQSAFLHSRAPHPSAAVASERPLSARGRSPFNGHRYRWSRCLESIFVEFLAGTGQFMRCSKDELQVSGAYGSFTLRMAARTKRGNARSMPAVQPGLSGRGNLLATPEPSQWPNLMKQPNQVCSSAEILSSDSATSCAYCATSRSASRRGHL